MTKRRKRTPSAWRVERQLISYVYEFPDITRSELAKRLGQSPAAISLVIRRLINNGWLQEAGRAASLGGRRPVQLRLSSGYAYTLGLDVTPNRIRGVLMDADGSVTNQVKVETKPNRSRKETIDRLVEAARLTAGETDLNSDQMLGVGIAMAGVVYSDSGMARATPGIFNWDNVDLVTDLADVFPEKLIGVDSSARARLSYEVYNQSALRQQTTLILDFGYTIGGALIVNGAPYRGADGVSLDVASLQVPTVAHGQRPLNEIASEPAVLERTRRMLETGYPSLLRETATPENLTLYHVARAAQAGDQLACRVMAEVADAVGQAVSSLANLLRPRLILFAGELTETGALALDSVKKQVRLSVMPDVYENLRLAASESDEYAAALGAAHLVLRKWLTELSPSKDGTLQTA